MAGPTTETSPRKAPVRKGRGRANGLDQGRGVHPPTNRSYPVEVFSLGR